MEKNGGRPKKETTSFEEIKTTGYSQKKPNVNDNKNVNDNVNANVNVGDSCANGLQEIIEFYNKNIGLITPYGIQVFEDYAKEMNIDVIIYAMEKAVEANVRTIKYIKGTLNNWQNAGVKTLVEAKEESQKFRNNRQETKEERIKRLKKEWGVENET